MNQFKALTKTFRFKRTFLLLYIYFKYYIQIYLIYNNITRISKLKVKNHIIIHLHHVFYSLSLYSYSSQNHHIE